MVSRDEPHCHQEVVSAGCGGKARKEGLGAAVADRGVVVGRQAIGGVQRRSEGRGDAVIVGEIGAEQNMAGTGEFLEGGQGGTG